MNNGERAIMCILCVYYVYIYIYIHTFFNSVHISLSRSFECNARNKLWTVLCHPEWAFFSLYICQDILRRWGWIHWRITQRVCDLQQVLEQSIIYWVYDLQQLLEVMFKTLQTGHLQYTMLTWHECSERYFKNHYSYVICQVRFFDTKK